MSSESTAADSSPRGGMVDLHGHWLPGVDDGARTLEQALNMARIAAADGITEAAMTPHHLNGVYSNPADKVRKLVTVFAGTLERENIGVHVVPGSECHLVPELPAAVKDGSALTLGGHGRAMLVELPAQSVPMGATDILEDLLAQGVQPVIVHPERNRAICARPGILGEWIGMGCLGQVTAQACTGNFGAPVRDVARQLIQNGWVHVIASDAHRDRRRVPGLSAARDQVSVWTTPELATWMVEDAPRALLHGQAVDLAERDTRMPATRRWWSLGRSRFAIGRRTA